jgi:O-antigen/teichoic acid export membrane protein
VKDVVIGLAVTACVMLLNFAGSVMAARLLLPAGRGELAAALLIGGLLSTIGLLSTDRAATWFVAAGRAAWGEIYTLSLLLGLCLSLLVVFGGGALLRPLLGDIGEAAVEAGYVFVAAVPFLYFNYMNNAQLAGRLKLTTWNLLRLMQPLFYVAGMALLATFDAVTVSNVVACWLLGVVLGIPVQLVALLRRSKGPWRPAFRLFGDFARYSLGIYAAAIFVFVNLQLDRLVITGWLDATALGLYAAAFTLTAPLTQIGTTLSQVAFPKVSAITAPRERAISLARYLKLAVVVGTGAVIVLWPLAGWLAPTLFGKAFAAAAEPMGPLVLMASLRAVGELLMVWVRAHGRSRPLVIIQGFGLAVKAAALFLLLPWGITGIAWAGVIDAALAIALLLFVVLRAGHIGPRALLLPTREDAAYLRDQLAGLRHRSDGGAAR